MVFRWVHGKLFQNNSITAKRNCII